MSMKFNEEKYTAALETIAQELINMVLDDYGQIDEDALYDYTNDSYVDIDNEVKKIRSKM